MGGAARQRLRAPPISLLAARAEVPGGVGGARVGAVVRPKRAEGERLAALAARSRRVVQRNAREEVWVAPQAVLPQVHEEAERQRLRDVRVGAEQQAPPHLRACGKLRWEGAQARSGLTGGSCPATTRALGRVDATRA